ncbi:MAG TPA: RHS repeat-associated core domain-containing protein [Candidatus Acidoferrales bacterium]|nr:RHS repeat-associated core domain-containing protein [Candidatus Acidoferrales bacterium]
MSGITNNRDATRTQSFTYDQVNRIVTAETSSTSGSNCWGETYTVDQWANLTAIGAASGYTGCAQEGLGVSATANNQLSSTGFSYDASGNMLTDGTNTYGWNAESEIKSAAGVNYTYDGDGNRVQKSSGKIYWYGAGTEILDESDLSGNFTNEYVFFGGKRIAMRNVTTGTIYYYTEDMLGSSRTMVQDGQTSPCYDADFYPFGGERDITATCSQNYKFEGKERDTETGNDDFGARYYSSRLGRWLSADWSAVPAPVPYANLTNPQTLNLYAMVSDNPETFADLDGHQDGTNPDLTTTKPPYSGRISIDVGGNGSSTDQDKQQQAQTAQPQNQQPQQKHNDQQPQGPDLAQQAADATAKKAYDAKTKQDAPPVGSPEYTAQVSSKINAETAAANKSILAPAAAVETAGLAAVAAPVAAAVGGAAVETVALHPAETAQFAEGFAAGATPGLTPPPPTVWGFAGYAAGQVASRAVSWIQDKF